MKRHALVVGINQYHHLQSLKAPVTGATAIARCLEKHGEFQVMQLPEPMTQTLSQLEEKQSGIDKISLVSQLQLKGALKQLFLPSNQQTPETALFYFSGYGLPDEEGYDKGYLATSETDPRNPSMGLSLGWLQWLLSQSPVKQQIIWLDCCHSGSLLVDVKAANPENADSRDRCFIASSRDFETSWEALNSPYSVLTKVLLEGLDPGRSKIQSVNTKDLVTYVHQALNGELQASVCHYFGKAIRITNTAQVQERIIETEQQNDFCQTNKDTTGFQSDIKGGRVYQGGTVNVTNNYFRNKGIDKQIEEPLPNSEKQQAQAERRKRAVFLIEGSIEDLTSTERAKLEILVQSLRDRIGDASLKIHEICEGSIRIVLEGSEDGMEELRRIVEAGEFNEILGKVIQRVEFFESQGTLKSSEDNQKNETLEFVELAETDKQFVSVHQEAVESTTNVLLEVNRETQAYQAGGSVQFNTTSQPNAAKYQNQLLGKVIGSVVLYVSGGQPIINLAQPGEEQTAEAAPAKKDIGPCPYRGLLAYYEQDSEYYFGRSKEVSRLWERFCELHQGQDKTRFLAIYGPSGSGKSSLARAGLIPALAKQPLQGKDKARVAVMVPGAQPLQKLAAILAQIYQPGLGAFSEARKLARELAIANEAGAFDGLHSFASSMLADIQTVPLVIVVDQFEEVYSLCKDTKERDAFIGNLLYAAAEVSQCVSVVVTFRSDFLGETSQNSGLNRLFSEQGFLAPNMDEVGLREAIAQPAEKAGHPLDEGTIQLLISQTQGREGALPLLQFALTRIWEGMGQGVEPARTLKDIGGVGGALAGTAQRIYDGLDKQEQAIASHFFMGLVQLGEGTQDTRRRVPVDDLISSQTEKEQVRRVLGQFASSDARLVTLASDNGQEVAEVSHEALIQHWGVLRHWIEQNRDLLRQQRKIEVSALAWQEQGAKTGYLLQGLPLNEAIQFNQHQTDTFPLSDSAKTFIKQSIKYRQIRRLKTASWLIIPASLLVGFAEHNLRESRVNDALGRLNSEGGYEERQAAQSLVKGCYGKEKYKLPHYISERLFGNCRSLFQAPLNAADLSKANLRFADLNEANLGYANLSYANLRNADLSYANLSYAYLNEANLINADLSHANLSNTDLSTAIALSTNFRSTNLTTEQLEGQKPPLLCNSPLPSNIAIDKDRDCNKLPSVLLERYPREFENLEQAREFVKEQREKTWE